MNKQIARDIFNTLVTKYHLCFFDMFKVRLKHFLRENDRFYILNDTTIRKWFNSFVRDPQLECMMLSWGRRDLVNGGVLHGFMSIIRNLYLQMKFVTDLRTLFVHVIQP